MGSCNVYLMSGVKALMAIEQKTLCDGRVQQQKGRIHPCLTVPSRQGGYSTSDRGVRVPQTGGL